MEQQHTGQAQPALPPSSSSAPQILGIISLVLGILGFLFSFIPCFGMYAFFPGILGIASGVTALALSAKSKGAKGMAIAGLVLAALGTAVACYQYNNVHRAITDITTRIRDSAEFRTLRDSINAAFPNIDTTNFDSKISIDTSEIR